MSQKLIPSIVILLIGLIGMAEFDAGIFWGLISITLAIVAFAVTNYLGERKDRLAYAKTQKSLDKISDYFEDSAKSSIEEKIAMLNKYRDSVKAWSKNEVDRKLDAITSDIRAINFLKDMMDGGQNERLNRAIRELKEEMKTSGYDSGRIDDVAKNLS